MAIIIVPRQPGCRICLGALYYTPMVDDYLVILKLLYVYCMDVFIQKRAMNSLPSAICKPWGFRPVVVARTHASVIEIFFIQAEITPVYDKAYCLIVNLGGECEYSREMGVNAHINVLGKECANAIAERVWLQGEGVYMHGRYIT